MHRFYHLNLNSYCSLEKSLFFPQSLGAVLNRQSCFPGDSDGEECACNVGDLGLIPGSGRSSGEGHGNSLQNSCLENSMNRGAWWATVPAVTKVRHY